MVEQQPRGGRRQRERPGDGYRGWFGDDYGDERNEDRYGGDHGDGRPRCLRVRLAGLRQRCGGEYGAAHRDTQRRERQYPVGSSRDVVERQHRSRDRQPERSGDGYGGWFGDDYRD